MDATLTGADLREDSWRVVMITDIVDSTAVGTLFGDGAYLTTVLHHHHIVRRSLGCHAGHEFSEAGDGLLAWFASTEDAFGCALHIHNAFDSDPVEPRLNIRIALAGGIPLFHNGRPYGIVLNRAARLLRHAQPNETVLDDALATLLPTIDFASRTATVQLKGIGTHNATFIGPGLSMAQRGIDG